MNRYVAEGIAADVVRGRRVMVLVGLPAEARALREECAGHMRALFERLGISCEVVERKANGQDEITLSLNASGWVKFRGTFSPRALRGVAPDVVLVTSMGRAAMKGPDYQSALIATGAEVQDI